MFKNLWYSIFGLPTVSSALADFKKIHAKLVLVAKLQQVRADEQSHAAAVAASAAGQAAYEVDRAILKADKIAAEWL